MEIKDAQAQKHALEVEIGRLVRTFEEETHLSVTTIDLNRVTRRDRYQPETVGVRVEVSL